MAHEHPPPDWRSWDEQDLECLVCRNDEEGARAALVELRRRHDEKLRAQARRQCGGRADWSEEAMQRLDARLWEKRRLYEPAKGRWLGWAKVILQNITTDLFREGSRFANPPAPRPRDADSSPGDWTEQVPAQEQPPDWRLKLQELQRAMADCLARLPPEEREALSLQVIDDLSLEEVGQRTGALGRTAGTRVYRAKERMRECLKRKGYERGEI
jgi:RNA polymerase sigma-70 factor (ECF subfamily)